MVCIKNQMYLMLLEDFDSKGCDQMNEEDLHSLHELVVSLPDIKVEERDRVNKVLTWDYMESRFYKHN